MQAKRSRRIDAVLITRSKNVRSEDSLSGHSIEYRRGLVLDMRSQYPLDGPLLLIPVAIVEACYSDTDVNWSY